MMRSLFSAISGLKNHQFLMDTVGNNIANVNTVAYKASRVTFQSLIDQAISPASAPTANRAGQNPIRIGLGSKIATVDQLLSQGNLQATGKPTDLALQGEGYLVLSDNAAQNPTYLYTRDGNLALGVGATATDPRPLVQSATGLHVKGYVPPQAAGTADSTTAPATDISIPATVNNVAVTGFNIDTNGVINLSMADGTVTTNYAQLALATFTNPGALLNTGNNMLQVSANSGPANYNGANINGRGLVSSGYLEMSNVDLANEFSTMIIAERGFQANSRVITASDEILQDLVNIKR